MRGCRLVPHFSRQIQQEHLVDRILCLVAHDDEIIMPSGGSSGAAHEARPLESVRPLHTRTR